MATCRPSCECICGLQQAAWQEGNTTIRPIGFLYKHTRDRITAENRKRERKPQEW